MKNMIVHLLSLLLVFPAFGANEAGEPSGPLFAANELSLDLYNTYRAVEPRGITRVPSTDIRHGDFGAGLGATYWATANFGAGLDANIPRIDGMEGVLFHQVSLNFSARLPLGHFAPHGFGGLARDFQNGLWSAHAGAGIEWRFQRRVGAFVDARYVFASHETDSLMMRAGVRFPF